VCREGERWEREEWEETHFWVLCGGIVGVAARW
jgi:hypothetical protein